MYKIFYAGLLPIPRLETQQLEMYSMLHKNICMKQNQFMFKNLKTSSKQGLEIELNTGPILSPFIVLLDGIFMGPFPARLVQIQI